MASSHRHAPTVASREGETRHISVENGMCSFMDPDAGRQAGRQARMQRWKCKGKGRRTRRRQREECDMRRASSHFAFRILAHACSSSSSRVRASRTRLSQSCSLAPPSAHISSIARWQCNRHLARPGCAAREAPNGSLGTFAKQASERASEERSKHRRRAEHSVIKSHGAGAEVSLNLLYCTACPCPAFPSFGIRASMPAPFGTVGTLLGGPNLS